jgi:TRAP-type C4-dicarboxylate transport system permease large subunit
MTVLAFAMVALLALAGLPLFLVLAGFAITGYISTSQSLELFFASNFRPIATSPVFLAIPLFTLAGYLMAESKTPERIVRFSKALVGFFPGGLAIVAVVACAVFTAFTGASGVTIVALGGLLLPALLKDGYGERFSLGLLTTGGSRGLLFPPSLPLIVYAMIAGLAMEGVGTFGQEGREQQAQVQKTEEQEQMDKEIDEMLESDEGEKGAPEKAKIGAQSANKQEEAQPAVPQVTQVSVDKLFVAGALPGAFAIILVFIYAMFASRKAGVSKQKFSLKELWLSFKAIIWEVPVPLIVIIGIYGGFFTAIDASAIVAMYVFIVEVFIYRDIKFSHVPKVFTESMVLVGGILLILMSALSLTNFFIDREVPQSLFQFVKSAIDSKFMFLVVLNIFLLIVGCLMDIFSAIMVVVPMITPIAIHYGIDPVHLGIVFLTNLEIGFSTPPVGVNLFVASLAFRRPVIELYRATLPFLGLSLIALVVITYWPDLSLFLVRLTGVE